jgi:hypothetical protein
MANIANATETTPILFFTLFTLLIAPYGQSIQTSRLRDPRGPHRRPRTGHLFPYAVIVILAAFHNFVW